MFLERSNLSQSISRVRTEGMAEVALKLRGVVSASFELRTFLTKLCCQVKQSYRSGWWRQ